MAFGLFLQPFLLGAEGGRLAAHLLDQPPAPQHRQHPGAALQSSSPSLPHVCPSGSLLLHVPRVLLPNNRPRVNVSISILTLRPFLPVLLVWQTMHCKQWNHKASCDRAHDHTVTAVAVQRHTAGSPLLQCLHPGPQTPAHNSQELSLQTSFAPLPTRNNSPYIRAVTSLK